MSFLADEQAAVAEVCEQIQQSDASLVLFFCSASRDLERLGRALRNSFSIPVVGCTSAGQIGRKGYVEASITAISLSSVELRATPYLIQRLEDSVEATDVACRAVADLLRHSSKRAFGVLLIDGLSKAEERITAALHQALGYIPLVGGSAADGLRFERTSVYYDGEFRSGAAVLTLFDTTLPFATFRVQNVRPTANRVVITQADAEQRIVYEINGKPAAAAYAQELGIDIAALDAQRCARHPLLLRLGDEVFVRSVRSVNRDGSLVFSCAVEEGLVLLIGELTSALDALRSGIAGVRERVGDPRLILGFDCVSRRLEQQELGQADAVGQFLSAARVFGFSSYGEQFEAIHVTQTFTGVAIAASSVSTPR